MSTPSSPLRCVICDSEPHEGERNGLSLRECPTCGLWWRKDFTVDLSYYEDNSIEHGSIKLQARLRNVRSRVSLLTKAVPDLEDVCDVGTGEGLVLKALQEAGVTHVVGVEPSLAASTLGKDMGLPIVRGGIETLPELLAEHAPISHFTLFHVTEHLPDPTGSLTSLYNLLPEGGTLMLETPTTNGYSLRRTGFKHKLIYPEHLFYFNEGNLETLLRTIGFSIVASGRRDFDDRNLSIEECLFRLGVHKSTQLWHKALRRVLSVLGLRPLLNALVIRLNRLDYMWVIARKTA